jgi:hypothetical protein
MKSQRFFHVVGNGQRNGERGYIHERTYRSIGAALNYAIREGRPVWILESCFDCLLTIQGSVGDANAVRWNSGVGLVKDRMPLLKLVG